MFIVVILCLRVPHTTRARIKAIAPAAPEVQAPLVEESEELGCAVIWTADLEVRTVG
jgi:hypothetical protein